MGQLDNGDIIGIIRVHIHTDISALPALYLHRHCPHPCHVKAKVGVSQKVDLNLRSHEGTL